MRFKNKNVLVIGAGKSGIAAAEFLVKRKAKVTIFDDEQAARHETTIDCGAKFEFEVDELMQHKFDLAILSPGISIRHPLAEHFKEILVSELALGFSQKPKHSVAITGTNGKTTVTHLVNNGLLEQGRKVALCGNVGIPISAVSLKRSTAVIEVSSFMLEIPQNQKTKKFSFRPKISCILNITQDHLERHLTMENYIASKAAISRHQKKRDILILNFDDENCKKIGEETVSKKVLWFSSKARVRGIYLDGKSVILNIGKEAKVVASLDDFNETREHLVYNILASTLMLKLLKVKNSKIVDSYLGRKTEKKHRIEHVLTTRKGVSFYNDSKATNVAATIAACSTFAISTFLLVGGISKGQDFSVLFKQLPPTVERIFAFGAAAAAVIKAATGAGFKNIEKHKNMHDALLGAKEAVTEPCVILLSPAAASFDEFSGYAERGRVFEQLVMEYDKTQ